MTQKYSTISVKTEGDETLSVENPDILSLRKQEALRFNQDTKHRRWLVKWMMWVVGVWLTVVLFITVLSGNILHVDVKVMCVLLATTTINVLGLSKIILNGMFRHENSEGRKKEGRKYLSD